MLSKDQILRKIGLIGSRPQEYVSKKRSITLKKSNKDLNNPKKADAQPLADDEKFHFLRRDQYFKSLNEIKIAKRKRLEEQKEQRTKA